MTAVVLTAKHQPGNLAGSIGHALSWVWHSDLAVITAVVHHQVPQSAQDAAFAVTLVLILAITTRRRKRPAR